MDLRWVDFVFSDKTNFLNRVVTDRIFKYLIWFKKINSIKISNILKIDNEIFLYVFTSIPKIVIIKNNLLTYTTYTNEKMPI